MAAWHVFALSLLAGAGLTVAAMAQAPVPQEGAARFVARPKIGNAQLSMPASVRWSRSVAGPGLVRVGVEADVDVQGVIGDISNISAKALNRSVPCGDAVKVTRAAARLTGRTSLAYDLRFRFVKRACAAGVPVEIPADVSCAARIGVSSRGSVVFVDVRGATQPPCRIEGLYQSVSDAIYSLVGVDVFRRHAVDLSALLPPAFRGVQIDIRSIAIDQPPQRAVVHIAGDGTMTEKQFEALVRGLEGMEKPRPGG